MYTAYTMAITSLNVNSAKFQNNSLYASHTKVMDMTQLQNLLQNV